MPPHLAPAPAGHTKVESYSPSNELTVLQVGSEWLTEKTGGLQRMHFELDRHLPVNGIRTLGLVAGSEEVAKGTNGRVVGAAEPGDSVWQRATGFRRASRSMLSQHNVDLIASHFPLYAAPLLDNLSEYPTVMHLHGPWSLESREEGQSALVVKAKWLLEKAVYGRGTDFIVLSEAFRNVFVQTYGVPSERITTIPAGVDSDAFRTGLSRFEAAEKLGWPAGRPIVLVVRRLVSRMGLENIIDAIIQVRRRQPDIVLHIAGTGPLEPALRRRIRERGLEDHVNLLGFVPEEDLATAYRAAHITMVPTIALEGMGCITLESLAAGTPVLVTPVGGLPEAVADLSDNLVLTGTSTAHLVDGMVQALNGRLQLPSSAECQSYVRHYFSWPVIARKVASVYRRAVSRRLS